MTVRGFKDRAAELGTYSGTASRQDQRLVDSISVLDPEWEVFSMDVGKAFAKGMTFAELSEMTGKPMRNVEFHLSGEDLEILRSIPGFEDYNPNLEVLEMIKPIYGLKDAPRAWRIKLDRVLRSWQLKGSSGLKPLKAAPEIYVAHSMEEAVRPSQISSVEKVLLENARQTGDFNEGSAKSQAIQEEIWTLTKVRTLLIILSTHVDDMNGASKKRVAEDIVKHIISTVGDCSCEFNTFAHTGVQHEHTPGTHYTHQRPYIQQLRPIDANKLKGKDDSDTADAELHADYMSLLGGLAWTILTRAEACVYIQALQRHNHCPTVAECRRLNLVLRYIRKVQSGVLFRHIRHPLKLVGMSDAAFKAQPDEGSGLALRGLITLLMDEDKEGPSSKSGTVHLLDWLTRRIRRVVRSTFSAE